MPARTRPGLMIVRLLSLLGENRGHATAREDTAQRLPARERVDALAEHRQRDVGDPLLSRT
ncbi:MAG: hypothetical protein DMD26_09875 [Gemmatimonadetes bacterium]|nr:MAG: hypothetical protein DMD26_09875 [Gemmatimonadota bacterium]